jgi:hypothetical protein
MLNRNSRAFHSSLTESLPKAPSDAPVTPIPALILLEIVGAQDRRRVGAVV